MDVMRKMNEQFNNNTRYSTTSAIWAHSEEYWGGGQVGDLI